MNFEKIERARLTLEQEIKSAVDKFKREAEVKIELINFQLSVHDDPFHGDLDSPTVHVHIKLG